MEERHHVQITLVGGNPTPVYQGIMHMKPKQVLMVCSDASEKDAENIEKELQRTQQMEIKINKISSSNLTEMFQAAEKIEQSLPKDISLSLNITGGMKLWTLAFTDVFHVRSECHTFFIGQDGTFFDVNDRMPKGKVAFDMDAQFRILGHSLDEFTPLTEYTDEDYDVLRRIKRWGTNNRFRGPLHNLAIEFVEQYFAVFGDNLYTHNFSIRDKNDNTMSWETSTHTFNIVLRGEEQTFSSPHAEHIVLNTGWFELYTAQKIGKKFGAEHVRLNCIFRNTSKAAKNEIDIIVNTGHKLVFVECKTQVAKSIDVDKFRSAVRNYGGTGSGSLFVTLWPMNTDAKEKCNDHGIKTFHFFEPGTYTTELAKQEAIGDLLEKISNEWNYK